MWLKNCTDVVKNWVIPNIFLTHSPCTKLCFSPLAWHMPGKKSKTSPCWRQVELLVDQQPDATIFYEIQGQLAEHPVIQRGCENPELNGDANRGRILGNCPASHGADCRRVIGSRLFQLIWFCCEIIGLN